MQSLKNSLTLERQEKILLKIYKNRNKEKNSRMVHFNPIISASVNVNGLNTHLF